MSKAYVSSMTTNTSKPFTMAYLMGMLILIVISLLLDIAIYNIFNNGVQAGWTKPVVGILAFSEAFIAYCFWKVIRG